MFWFLYRWRKRCKINQKTVTCSSSLSLCLWFTTGGCQKWTTIACNRTRSPPAEARSEPGRTQFTTSRGQEWTRTLLPWAPWGIMASLGAPLNMPMQVTLLSYRCVQYIEPSLFLLPLELLCCSLVACFLNTSYSREGSWQGLRHQTSILAPLDLHFAPPDLDVGAPRPRFLNVLGLFLCYITTLLHCYVVTLLLCCFVTLELARWKDRSFAALLDIYIYIFIYIYI